MTEFKIGFLEGTLQIKKLIVNGSEIKNVYQYVDNPRKISLDLFFEGKDELEFEIIFLQKPPQNSYQYILQTTKSWKKPLQSCKINLHFPEEVNLLDCNYELISMEKEEGKGNNFQLYKLNFFPQKDLDFSWIDMK